MTAAPIILPSWGAWSAYSRISGFLGGVSVCPHSPAVKTVKYNKLIKNPERLTWALKSDTKIEDQVKTDKRYYHTLKSVLVISVTGFVETILRALMDNLKTESGAEPRQTELGTGKEKKNTPEQTVKAFIFVAVTSAPTNLEEIGEKPPTDRWPFMWPRKHSFYWSSLCFIWATTLPKFSIISNLFCALNKPNMWKCKLMKLKWTKLSYGRKSLHKNCIWWAKMAGTLYVDLLLLFYRTDPGTWYMCI